jgi:hypothetical protein
VRSEAWIGVSYTLINRPAAGGWTALLRSLGVAGRNLVRERVPIRRPAQDEQFRNAFCYVNGLAHGAWRAFTQISIMGYNIFYIIGVIVVIVIVLKLLGLY